MATRTTHRTITLTEWRRKAEVLENLYITKDYSMTELRTYMLENYGFNASRQQYERALPKLGFRKRTNRIASEWQAHGEAIAESRTRDSQLTLENYTTSIVRPQSRARSPLPDPTGDLTTHKEAVGRADGKTVTVYSLYNIESITEEDCGFFVSHIVAHVISLFPFQQLGLESLRETARVCVTQIVNHFAMRRPAALAVLLKSIRVGHRLQFYSILILVIGGYYMDRWIQLCYRSDPACLLELFNCSLLKEFACTDLSFNRPLLSFFPLSLALSDSSFHSANLSKIKSSAQHGPIQDSQLTDCIRKRSIEQLRDLLAKGCLDTHINCTAVLQDYGPESRVFTEDALILAVRDRFEDGVVLLLRHGIDINHVCKFTGTTALVTAVAADDPSMVELLLKHEADIDQVVNTRVFDDLSIQLNTHKKWWQPTCTSHMTALGMACAWGNVDLARKLYEHGAVIAPTMAPGIQYQLRGSPLYLAVRFGSDEMVCWLHEQTEYVLELASDVRDVIWELAEKGCTEAVMRLCDIAELYGNDDLEEMCNEYCDLAHRQRSRLQKL